MSGGKIIGIFYDPWAGIRVTPASFRNPLRLWRKAVWYRANPRSREYMQALLAERFPDAEFVEIGARPLSIDMDIGATNIVMLYPDAIGLGFTSIER
jgi:hypothetical protein